MQIPFVHELDITYGSCDQVSPLIRRVVAENPSPFTYLGTGTYLVGRGEVAVIDPGPADEAHIDAIVGALDPGETITHLVVTHTHTDHSPGAALLQARTGAPTYGFGPHGDVPEFDKSDKLHFGDPVADGEVDLDGKPIVKTGDEPKEGADTDFVPDHRLLHGHEVNGPGWTLTAVHTPGHTSNHLCYCLEQERALFTGDHVMGWSTTVIGPPDGQMEQYLASLELLLTRDDEVYWPTHGPPITAPRRHVEAFLGHRRAREAEIIGALRDGLGTLVTIVPVLYAEVDKRLWRPAAASVYAHLLGLVADGRVEVVGGGEPRFSSTYVLR